MTAAPVGTKTRILDAAEKLFGKNGFEETSLRDITAEAQVNLAAVNYHFHTKESLIDAVILRRLEPVNRRRLEILDAAGDKPTVEQIVRAFLAPVIEADLPNVAPLIGRVFSNPAQFAVRVFQKDLAPVVRRFDQAIALAVPGLTPEERFWRLNFMAGAMTHLLAMWDVFPMMTTLPIQPVDRAAVVRRMIQFLAAGLRAPLSEKLHEEKLHEEKLQEEKHGAEKRDDKKHDGKKHD
jgi:AcrR family transcriptional regulator